MSDKELDKRGAVDIMDWYGQTEYDDGRIVMRWWMDTKLETKEHTGAVMEQKYFHPSTSMDQIIEHIFPAMAQKGIVVTVTYRYISRSEVRFIFDAEFKSRTLKFLTSRIESSEIPLITLEMCVKTMERIK